VPHLDDHPWLDTGTLGDALDGEVVNAPGDEFGQRGVKNRLPLRRCHIFHRLI